jgi:2-keto-3-deoxy-L-rhamnonate aldolase RhmA
MVLTVRCLARKQAFYSYVLVLFIGPWDLGNNLGYPVQGDFAPELKEAIARILKAATDAGKKAGIYCPSGEFARRYADQGFHMVCSTLWKRTSLIVCRFLS